MAIHGESGKPYIISLSGLKLADNLEMLTQVAAASKEFPGTIAAVELNLACPNIPGMPCLLLPHCDWSCAQANQQWRSTLSRWRLSSKLWQSTSSSRRVVFLWE